MAGAGVVLAAGGVLALRQRILGPLTLATEAVRALAGGDLSTEIAPAVNEGTGQLQAALRQLTINLRAIISDVRTNVQSIEHSTREIADGNQDLAGRTEAQASSLEETASSMEQ